MAIIWLCIIGIALGIFGAILIISPKSLKKLKVTIPKKIFTFKGSKNITKTSTTTTVSKKNIWNTIIIVIAIMVIIFIAINLIMFGASAYSYVKELFTEEKTQSTVYEKSEMIYYFNDFKNGRITKNIKKGAEIYPIGGKIKFQTPSGNIITQDTGIRTVYDEPIGDYTFWKGSSSATGIRIVQ